MFLDKIIDGRIRFVDGVLFGLELIQFVRIADDDAAALFLLHDWLQ